MSKYILLVSAALVLAEARPKGGLIFNGDDADEGEWKWMLAVQRGGSFRCGGVLIGSRYALTAAHCVDRAGNYSVILGDYNRTDDNGDEQEVAVEEITVHPEWDDIFLDNDIAVLKLSEKADRSRGNIKPLSQFADAAIDKQIKSKDTECYVTGWGFETDENGYWRLAPVLQELRVGILSNGKCRRYLFGLNGKSNICYIADNAATCSGDSGSPMVCKVSKKWYLVGVHSFRLRLDGCRGGAKAGTRVSLFTDWIASLM